MHACIAAMNNVLYLYHIHYIPAAVCTVPELLGTLLLGDGRRGEIHYIEVLH